MDSKEYLQLHRKRTAQRGHTTRLINEADAIVNTQTAQKPDLQKVERLISLVKEKIELLSEINEDMLSYIEDEDQYMDISSEAEEHLKGIKDRKFFYEQYAHEKQKDVKQFTLPDCGSNYRQKTNLPKLTLPYFDGDLMEWQPFWDSFNAVVHTASESSIPLVQKFQYLQSLLKGPAALCLSGLTLTESNYQHAIDVLQQRYGQEHKIINAHLQALVSLPAPNNSIQSLCTFRDNMESHIRSLDALNEKTDSYGDMLVSVVTNKLPPTIRSNIVRAHGNRQFTLNEMRNFLFREIEILQASDNESLQQPTVSAMVTAAKPNNTTYKHSLNTPRNKTMFCVYCKSQEHYPTDCSNVKNYEERLKIVKQLKLCFNCLAKSHHVSDCPSRFKCKHCRRKHHSSLCDPNKIIDHTINSSGSVKLQTINTSGNSNKNSSSFHCNVEQSITDAVKIETSHPILYSSSTIPPTLLKTAIAEVESEICKLEANILFDDGSQCSFITQTFAEKLGLQAVSRREINLAAFGSKNTQSRLLNVVNLKIPTEDETIELNLLIVPHISTPLNIAMLSKVTEYSHLSELKLAHPVTDSTSFSIDILIGADHYYKIIEEQQVKGSCGPVAVKSKLGFVLSGPLITQQKNSQETVTMLNVLIDHKSDDSALEAFWKLESLGIENPTDKTVDKTLNTYCNSIKYEDGSYVAKLTWAKNPDTLPTNYGISKLRTKATISRLSKDLNLLEQYNKLIVDQETRGFIEKVPIYNCAKRITGPCHYIPHHPVFKTSATTPMRVVYDCSCRQNESSPSLNDFLQSGVPLQNDISSILIRFRLYKYGVVSDIEKAFLQIKLDEHDKDFTRFLWLSDPKNPKSDLVEYRFNVVFFGAKSSPFILNATILKHLNSQCSDVARDLLRNVYVDNFFSSVDDPEQLLFYYAETRNMMSEGHFNVRSWSSNCDTLRLVALKDGSLETSTVVSTLGLQWDIQTDQLSFAENSSLNGELITKREILLETCSIFDPLGFIAPVTMCAKIFMQKLWLENLDWDEPVSQTLCDEWKCITYQLRKASQIEFNRCPHPDNKHSDLMEIHVFADASIKGYGACGYIKNSHYKPYLCMAKSRVAPLKKLTIPQLELSASVIAARLAKHICKSLEFEQHVKQVLWTDSKIVLSWINSTKTLPIFVSNRVREIKSTTDSSEWHYCTSDSNPADLISRGCTSAELSNKVTWWHGPQWLIGNSDYNTQLPVVTDIIHSAELLAMYIPDVNSLDTKENIQTPIIDIKKYSSYTRLKRITSFVFRYISNLKKNQNVKETGELTVTELKKAEVFLIKQCQSEQFKDVLEHLTQNSSHRTPQIITQLRLFLDESGLIRSGSRIGNSVSSFDTKYPILLPTNHHLTSMIIRYHHKLILHSGVNHTVASIRQMFWVPRIRQVVKRLLRHCVQCKRVIGRPYTAPRSPHLPDIRVQESNPFTVTGIDFTGHLYVSDNPQKVYICLFTCAVTRAVHLEVLSDLGVESFLQAFRRFVSRCGLPAKIVSDNAKTFESSSSHLKELLSHAKLTQELSLRNIDWLFIPKRAPWFGGFWERLIGLTKTTLKKILGSRQLSYMELVTVVTEVEAAINDRPLTYISSDIGDPEPITPSKLLYGRNIITLPHLHTENIDDLKDLDYSDQSKLTKRSKHISFVLKAFWKQWKNDYLLSLREYYNKSKNRSENVKVGDIVQIHDDCSRLKWKLGLITALHKGNDGHTRSVALRTSTGITNRPIIKLYPLEVCDRSFSQSSEQSAQRETVCNVDPCPKRQAAIKAREQIKKLCSTSDSE